MLQLESNRIIATQAMKERIAADGADPAPPNTPAEYRASLARTIDTLRNFIAKTGFKTQ